MIAKRDSIVATESVQGTSKPSGRSFTAARRSLEGLGPEACGALIEAAADVTLVVDRKGVIQDLAVGSNDLPLENADRWIGQPWAEVVTVESRTKVEALLRDAAQSAPRMWRHINHPIALGSDLPILYSAVPTGQKGRVIAFGRDMRPLANLQQRLVDAQHSLERDYWRLRHVESRYRLLFEVSAEAILIVDAASAKVVEANPAANTLLAFGGRRIVGQVFPFGVDARAGRNVSALMARVRSTGRSDEIKVRSQDSGLQLRIGVSIFKQEDSQLFLVRVALADAGTGAASGMTSAITKVVENAPDGFVVTDLDGHVLIANPAFAELAQMPGTEPLRGESLDRWLGRPGVDLSVMLATLRQQGSLRLFATSLRGEHGASADVEISGVSVPDGDPPCLGFTVRHIGRRITGDVANPKSAPRSVEQLTKLVGRVPLKDLVRESTDLIEQLCIEAALELTRDNRASAAEMLGLSRQSLYVKLRRYGLGDLGSDN